ncbi:CCA tRNA nucleotidyltransferase [Erythrobacter litoralis]|uniref:CCA tRNA nucleotidyltransferase n=1 Tax=Erythrobacter litoralis TaxID=39960 RepID=UPI002434E795|nr:CCA tRNA nucleotidyltransferase [Erythrobacter litoralis]MDG6078753.1 CCA tRNA nucleotidyltransferase [Erythrobacter litoralis]
MTASLPQSPWTQRDDLAALMAALGKGKARYVGGAVRDTLLGKAIHDIDCATVLMPNAVIERCTAAGIKTVPTGIDHGTVTAVLPQGNVEITTLRRDVSTDGRRATVTYAAEWHEDAARRDFTINALYADPETLEIADFFGGLEDLAAHRVRFIGNAAERIREDHLRILRYFRFQARFGDTPDPDAIEACRNLAHTLKGLSRERIAMELLAILALPTPVDTIVLMRKLGVLPVILPEATDRTIDVLKKLIAQELSESVAANPIRRLGALLPPISNICEAVAARLRLSKQHRNRLMCIAERTSADSSDPRALAYRTGMECAQDRLLILGESLAPFSGWSVPKFPLNGGRIVERGIAAGPQVAKTMREVEARWVDEGFPDEPRIAELLDEVLAQRSTV